MTAAPSSAGSATGSDNSQDSEDGARQATSSPLLASRSASPPSEIATKVESTKGEQGEREEAKGVSKVDAPGDQLDKGKGKQEPADDASAVEDALAEPPTKPATPPLPNRVLMLRRINQCKVDTLLQINFDLFRACGLALQSPAHQLELASLGRRLQGNMTYLSQLQDRASSKIPGKPNVTIDLEAPRGIADRFPQLERAYVQLRGYFASERQLEGPPPVAPSNGVKRESPEREPEQGPSKRIKTEEPSVGPPKRQPNPAAPPPLPPHRPDSRTAAHLAPGRTASPAPAIPPRPAQPAQSAGPQRHLNAPLGPTPASAAPDRPMSVAGPPPSGAPQTPSLWASGANAAPGPGPGPAALHAPPNAAVASAARPQYTPEQGQLLTAARQTQMEIQRMQGIMGTPAFQHASPEQQQGVQHRLEALQKNFASIVNQLRLHNVVPSAAPQHAPAHQPAGPSAPQQHHHVPQQPMAPPHRPPSVHATAPHGGSVANGMPSSMSAWSGGSSNAAPTPQIYPSAPPNSFAPSSTASYAAPPTPTFAPTSNGSPAFAGSPATAPSPALSSATVGRAPRRQPSNAFELAGSPPSTTGSPFQPDAYLKQQQMQRATYEQQQRAAAAAGTMRPNGATMMATSAYDAPSAPAATQEDSTSADGGFDWEALLNGEAG